MSKSTKETHHYCATCGSLEVKVMVWARWHVKSQAWKFVSDDGVGETYCNQCEQSGVRVLFGTKQDVRLAADRGVGHE